MFKVQIHDIKNASVAEKKAFYAACLQLELEVNDPDFWYEVAIEYNYWGEQKELAQYSYRPQTFKQFKEEFLSGRDNFNGDTDSDMDLMVTMYYSFRSVVGYTKPSTWFTWANRNIIKGFDVGELAGHIAHEYLHNLGLGHTNANRNSVVYKFGYLVRDRIQDRLALPDTINIYYRRSLWTRVKRLFRGIF